MPRNKNREKEFLVLHTPLLYGFNTLRADACKKNGPH